MRDICIRIPPFWSVLLDPKVLNQWSRNQVAPSTLSAWSAWGSLETDDSTCHYLDFNDICSNFDGHQVTDVDKMHYFDMTRLGAFLAIPVVYQSYYNGALLSLDGHRGSLLGGIISLFRLAYNKHLGPGNGHSHKCYSNLGLTLENLTITTPPKCSGDAYADAKTFEEEKKAEAIRRDCSKQESFLVFIG